MSNDRTLYKCLKTVAREADHGRHVDPRGLYALAERAKELEAKLAAVEGDERLTREEWLAQLEQAAAEAQNGEDWYVKLWFTKAGGNDAWAAQGQEKVVYGSDPIAALEALAAKPSRPDPDEMDEEECKREIDETDDAFYAIEAIDIGVERLIVAVVNEVVYNAVYGNKALMLTGEEAFRAAVRALREHLDAQGDDE